MAEYLIQDTSLNNIADQVRSITGLTGSMTPTEMATNLNNYNTEINELLATQEAKIDELTAALEDKVSDKKTCIAFYSCSASVGFSAMCDKNGNELLTQDMYDSGINEVDLSDYIGDFIYVYGNSNADLGFEITTNDDNGEIIPYTETSVSFGGLGASGFPYDCEFIWAFIVPGYDIYIMHDPGDVG